MCRVRGMQAAYLTIFQGINVLVMMRLGQIGRKSGELR